MKPVSIYTPGNWDLYDSYGLIACQLARQLAAMGLHVNAMGRGQVNMPNQPPDLSAITSRPIIPSLGGIVLGYPSGYDNHPNLLHAGPKVAITMFESSKIPPDWIEPLNACHAVIVPARFLIPIFRDCGVTAPIHAIPLGIGEAYAPKPRQATHRPFRFLAFLDRGRRKGLHWAQFAFMRAFGDDSNVELWLKGRAVKDAQPNDPRIFAPTNPNFRVIQQDLTEAELADLYCECDALINPNMGEGWGLIPREFAATGGIALTTGWGGTGEDIEQWGIPLPYAMEAADWAAYKNFKGMDLGQWAMPDLDGCAAIMRDVVANRDHYASDALSKAPAVGRMYNWRGFAEGVWGVFQQAAQRWAGEQTQAAG